MSGPTQALLQVYNHSCLQQQHLYCYGRLACEAGTAGPRLLPGSAERSSGAGLDWQPSWQLASANTWRKRTQVLQRFIGAVRKVVYRLRAQRQLDRFKRLLGER
jgi:hypothetical protein